MIITMLGPPESNAVAVTTVLSSDLIRTLLRVGAAPHALKIDLAELQHDEPVSLTIYRREDGAPVLEPTPIYLALVHIPQRLYRFESVPGGELGPDGQPESIRVPEPIDLAAVRVDLFPLLG